MNSQTELTIPDSSPAGKGGVLSALIGAVCKKRAYIIELCMTFALVFGRYLYYGWTYFTQLDDYIQFNNYSAYYQLRASSLWEYINQLGMMTQRPLAGLSDVYIWSRMFGSLIAAVLILSLMYCISAVILRYVLNKLFGTGYFFTLIFCLLPLSLEGLYWVSASSRIIPAVFFASLATLFIYRITVTGKMPYLFLFAAAQLLCFGFYEQVAVLSIALSVLITVSAHNKYSITVLLSLANSLIYILYSQIGSLIWQKGIYAGRGALALPFVTDSYLERIFIPAAKQAGGAFAGYLPPAFIKSLTRGVKIIIDDKAYIYVAALAAVCVLLVLLLRRAGRCAVPDKRSFFVSLAWGAFLAVAPLAPFFLTENSPVSLRSVVPCLCGIALIADTLLRALTRGKRRIVIPLLTLCVFACCITSVSELHDYRETTEYDTAESQKVIESVNEAMTVNKMDQNTSIAILNMSTTATQEQNYPYHEHIASCTAGTWSFTGLLRCLSGNGNFPNVTAMPVDENGCFYYASHGDSFRLENYDYVFVKTDYAIILVIPARGFTEDEYDPRANYDSYLLYTVDVARLAHVAEYSDHGTFEFY